MAGEPRVLPGLPPGLPPRSPRPRLPPATPFSRRRTGMKASRPDKTSCQLSSCCFMWVDAHKLVNVSSFQILNTSLSLKKQQSTLLHNKQPSEKQRRPRVTEVPSEEQLSHPWRYFTKNFTLRAKKGPVRRQAFSSL